MTILFMLAGCYYESEYKGGGGGLPGQLGCSITAQEIVDADTPSAGPSANEILATVSGVQRTTTFVPGDGLTTQEPWEEAIRFDFALRASSQSESRNLGWGLEVGEVVAVSYVPEEGEIGATCTAGDFLVAPVTVQVEGDHMDGTADGYLWWQGSDLAADLLLTFYAFQSLSVDPTIEALSKEAADQQGCGSPVDYSLVTAGRQTGSGSPLGTLSLGLDAVSEEQCPAHVADNDGLWEETAP